MQAQVQVKSPKAMAAVLMLATFLGLFGETSLNMALTNVMDDFHASASTAAWLTTGYLLVLAVLIPLSSYLGRWFTTRQLLIAALSFSTIGSLIAAISPNFTFLLVGRLIQALGTGMFLPMMFSIVLLIFPMDKRGPVMGIVGIILTAGPALGPSISGLIISSLSWHYIFWIMMVCYVVLLVLALSKVDNIGEITRPRIDFLSFISSTLGFGGVIFALATLADKPFSDATVWAPLVVGLILLVVFATRQSKLDEPMIDLTVFKSPMFTLGVALMVATMFMILSVAILIPMFLKTVLGYTAIAAGLLMLPGNVLNIIMSPIVGTNFDKVGAKKFTRIGFTMILVSMIIFLSVISATTATWVVVVNLCIFFVGVSMTIMPAQTNAMNSLAPRMFADGSAALNTLTQTAGAAGTAVAITMFTVGQEKYAEKFGAADVPAMLASGVHTAFIVATVISALGLIGSFFVKNSRQTM